MIELGQRQKDYQLRVDEILQGFFQVSEEHAPKLKSAMQYALFNGGKRMRPFLVYATGEMLGAKQQDLDYPAVAIECIHAYSLVHDDLPAMDDDDLRRGKATCHIAYDEATAILAGDALQTMAFDILANATLSHDSPKMQLALIKQLSHASGYDGMCGGQAIDLASTDKRISQAQLQQLHSLKTGALLRVAVSMAATLSPDVAPESTRLLNEFSVNLGLAFQVQDDILDIVGDSSTLGKPQGSDQAQNKSTYPSILGLRGAKDYLSQLHQQALHALRALPYNTSVLETFTDFTVQRNH
ncbi:(2E,6E)-farnesyl diphosphate synthase [Aliiglaciecola sp. LCG003]|uniref:(2E,6E)-farnesyl diphosphate synthase n=1 Tax=Aliiglaciecola sp. LCG003 TaxID=3053655 RepID=UPI0025734249|nr:farnesyl diphosphate synthase [Aliiglaciecola sp. LCG003]WJG08412.1 (2E,6E)-farnesyl diphosphate synthase [Aliiglaciecola sp. LCG003]